MVRYMVLKRVRKPEDLKSFNGEFSAKPLKRRPQMFNGCEPFNSGFKVILQDI